MRKQLFLPFILFISGCAFWRSPRPTEENPLLAIQRNDHIGIIGGGLADRMQHSGYLEALIHQKYPDYNLVFRNLGFAGDEVVTRMRSENFGSPHDWLKHEKATIVWAFF
ncbi:hypothetical protein HYR69_06190, partial [Candidatus Sumerlaeota bacterium]|nr:hypothetical protein [Candidatus Sumerlaeota bacterium]